MSALKRKQVRIYLGERAEENLAKMVTNIVTQTDTAILTEIVEAGLKACAADGYRLRLPLFFEITDPPQAPSRLELNDLIKIKK
jgi:hypothetical protein